MLRLGRHSKQAGDEGGLILDVALPHPSDLSLPDHVHDLVPLQRSPGRFKGKEAQPWFDHPFEKAVVLLDQVSSLLHSHFSSHLIISIVISVALSIFESKILLLVA